MRTGSRAGEPGEPPLVDRRHLAVSAWGSQRGCAPESAAAGEVVESARGAKADERTVRSGTSSSGTSQLLLWLDSPSSTSLTFRISSSAVNGFWMNAASSWLTPASHHLVVGIARDVEHLELGALSQQLVTSSPAPISGITTSVTRSGSDGRSPPATVRASRPCRASSTVWPCSVRIFQSSSRTPSSSSTTSTVSSPRTERVPPTQRARLRLHPGEEDLDRGALPRLAGDPDDSPVLFHDAIDDRESEPGAAA